METGVKLYEGLKLVGLEFRVQPLGSRIWDEI